MSFREPLLLIGFRMLTCGVTGSENHCCRTESACLRVGLRAPSDLHLYLLEVIKFYKKVMISHILDTLETIRFAFVSTRSYQILFKNHGFPLF